MVLEMIAVYSCHLPFFCHDQDLWLMNVWVIVLCTLLVFAATIIVSQTVDGLIHRERILMCSVQYIMCPPLKRNQGLHVSAITGAAIVA